MTYRSPDGRELIVGEHERVKRAILESLGWRAVASDEQLSPAETTKPRTPRRVKHEG